MHELSKLPMYKHFFFLLYLRKSMQNQLQETNSICGTHQINSSYSQSRRNNRQKIVVIGWSVSTQYSNANTIHYITFKFTFGT